MKDTKNILECSVAVKQPILHQQTSEQNLMGDKDIVLLKELTNRLKNTGKI